jgi:hypothetical protein
MEIEMFWRKFKGMIKDVFVFLQRSEWTCGNCINNRRQRMGQFPPTTHGPTATPPSSSSHTQHQQQQPGAQGRMGYGQQQQHTAQGVR